MGNGTYGQRSIMCNIKDRDGGYLGGWGTWAMGHMSNWAHDHNVGKWVSWLILKIEMGHLGGWGTWGSWGHGQCGHVLDHVQLP